MKDQGKTGTGMIIMNRHRITEYAWAYVTAAGEILVMITVTITAPIIMPPAELIIMAITTIRIITHLPSIPER